MSVFALIVSPSFCLAHQTILALFVIRPCFVFRSILVLIVCLSWSCLACLYVLCFSVIIVFVYPPKRIQYNVYIYAIHSCPNMGGCSVLALSICQSLYVRPWMSVCPFLTVSVFQCLLYPSFLVLSDPTKYNCPSLIRFCFTGHKIFKMFDTEGWLIPKVVFILIKGEGWVYAGLMWLSYEPICDKYYSGTKKNYAINCGGIY